MTRNELIHQIRQKKTFLCIGLDTELKKLPEHLLDLPDPVFEFNRAIIDATQDLAIAYKPNLAFYESMGSAGWHALKKTIDYLHENYPDLFIIADAKRGDIGNTAQQYAKALLDNKEGLGCDAITLSPYMGEDSIRPFLDVPGKWVIVLALTSNPGSADFQTLQLDTGRLLFEEVLHKAISWGSDENIMFVVGATHSTYLKRIRETALNHFLLVPGIGAQGGSLREVATHLLTREIGLIVNASRSIIYASSGNDYAFAARAEAQKLQQEMKHIIENQIL